MRKLTTLAHIAGFAIAAASILAVPTTASAEVYSTKPCKIVPGTDGCAPTQSGGNKLPGNVIATKRAVETRGVSQPNLKPNICATRPEAFKGCAAYN